MGSRDVRPRRVGPHFEATKRSQDFFGTWDGSMIQKLMRQGRRRRAAPRVALVAVTALTAVAGVIGARSCGEEPSEGSGDLAGLLASSLKKDEEYSTSDRGEVCDNETAVDGDSKSTIQDRAFPGILRLGGAKVSIAASDVIGDGIVQVPSDDVVQVGERYTVCIDPASAAALAVRPRS